MNELIITNKEDLQHLINEAIRSALPTTTTTAIEAKPEPFIKGVHQLAKFLRVSPARAQKMKNEGLFPYFQNGRTLLFDPQAVRMAMQGGK